MKINKNITHIRLLSDLHVEFTEYLDVPSLPEDKTTLLILAGDIHVGEKVVPYLESLACQFGHVLYVFGNHEYYHQNFSYIKDKVQEKIDDMFVRNGLEYNISIAADVPEILEFDNARVLAGTLWTDMNNGDPLTKLEVANYLNDYHLVRKRTKKLTPDDTMKVFHKTVKAFEEFLQVPFDKGPTIIATHHLPSEGAVDPRYQIESNYRINAGYRSNLDDFILKYQPNYWFFGHSHSTTRKELGKTLLMSNPRGYPKRTSTRLKLIDELIDTEDFENPNFDPLFRIAI